ncbi:MAG: PTS sugar transporter subunit IIB [Massilimicrobiota sp.]|nr:PTS sugar transporter subunit IIB [Massilimicrobiota sp.]
MIKLVRLDERFIHGQVAFAWTNNLGADCIFIVNDEVASDKLRQTSLKLAAPAGVKFIVKNVEDAKKALLSGKTKKYKIFLIVDNTRDVLELAKVSSEIKQLNLGNMRMMEGRKSITNSICISDEDIENIKELEKLGVEVECRAIPTDKKVRALDLV